VRPQARQDQEDYAWGRFSPADLSVRGAVEGLKNMTEEAEGVVSLGFNVYQLSPLPTFNFCDVINRHRPMLVPVWFLDIPLPYRNNVAFGIRSQNRGKRDGTRSQDKNMLSCDSAAKLPRTRIIFLFRNMIDFHSSIPQDSSFSSFEYARQQKVTLPNCIVLLFSFCFLFRRSHYVIG
jgi:hypothetical protein